ncbi:MAG: TauD/TfdA family dioxygenase [Pseudomonadota bacterium]
MRIEATAVEDYNHIRVEPLTGTIGAEVSGVDLRDFNESIIEEIQHAWLAHKVLFFRDQALTMEEHIAYGRALGRLEIHPFTPNSPEHPEIIILNSTPDRFFAAETWHTDVTFRARPPLGSILLGRVIPSWGGDTCFANMELAYKLLPDEFKEEIDSLYAIHSLRMTFGRRMDEAALEKALCEYPDQKHPVVRSHPETGRKSIFVNINFTHSIADMAPEDSESLLKRLYAQAKQPEVQCRFRWRPNSIAQWDNRCTQHYAVPDHGGVHRCMERVTLVGDRPH